MAKGNLLLGMGRGSIGDITLYRAYGSQVSRARAKVVKNPRTEAQEIQRIIMATTVYGYSAMKEICDHSFQGKSYGAECMNRFNSLNAQLLRGKLAKDGLDWPDPYVDENGVAAASFNDAQGYNPKGIAPNNWIISEGTLPEIPFGWSDATAEDNFGVEIPVTFTFADGISYEELAQKLGVQVGDQITVCGVDLRGNFHYGRFILSANDGDQTHSVFNSTYWNARNLNITCEDDENSIVLTVDSMHASGVGLASCGVILSRRDGTGWKRSNSKMKVLNVDMAGVGVAMETALWQKQTGDIDVTSPYYLNNANQATTEGGSEEENP